MLVEDEPSFCPVQCPFAVPSIHNELNSGSLTSALPQPQPIPGNSSQSQLLSDIPSLNYLAIFNWV